MTIANVGFHVLGELTVTADGAAVDLGTPKERQLLAALLVANGSVVARDRVVESLWPDRRPAKPMSSLRAYLSHLRAALAGAGAGRDVLVTLDGGYRLDVDPRSIDAVRFERAVRAASDATALRSDRIRLLDEALGSVRGEPFADMPYAEFAQAEIQRLDELVGAAHELRGELALDAGEAVAWIPHLTALVARYPYRDRVRGLHMRALASTGRHGEALRSFAEHRMRLVDDLGVEPGPELRTLEAELLALDTVDEVADTPARSDVPDGHAAPRLLGRDEELGMLRRRFEHAAGGEGQIVVVGGEAGVGKTRLVEALLDDVADRRPTVARLNCLPDCVQAALYPLRDHLGSRSRGRSMSQDPDGSLAAARRLLADWLRDGERALDVVSPDPDERRRSLLRAALVELSTPLDDGPVVCVVEDVQWIDASTDELLSSLGEIAADRSLLLIVTHRTPDVPVVADLADATHLRLGGLTRRVTSEIVELAAGGHELSDEVIAGIAVRANGVPLFAEELTRDAIGRGDGFDRAVPVTLGDSLATRLADVGPAAATVQAAAALGFTFDVSELVAIVDRDEPAVTADLDHLVRAGIVVHRGRGTETAYRFRHQLVRDVVHDALPSVRRCELHFRAAEMMERAATSGGTARRAHHWTEAGDAPRATAAWLDAARRALSVAALHEAADSGQRGLAIASGAPPDEVHDAVVELHLLLGATNTQLEGPASTAAKQHYDVVLAGELAPTASQRFRALWGRWYAVSTGADLSRMLPTAERLLALSSELDDDEVRIQAHHAMWSSLRLAGRFREALDHVELGRGLYQSVRHHHLTFDYGGHDPGVCMLSTGGLMSWMLGATDEGAAQARAAVELADRFDHDYSQLEASFGALTIALLDGAAERLMSLVEELEEVVDAGRVPALASGFVAGHRAVAELMDGHGPAALAELEAAAPRWRTLWGCHCFPLDGALASARLASGDADGALAGLGAILDDWTDRGSWWDAELHRHRAGATAVAGSPEADVIGELTTAAAIARNQEAVVFELRALVDLITFDADAAPTGTRIRIGELTARIPAGHPDAIRAREAIG